MKRLFKLILHLFFFVGFFYLFFAIFWFNNCWDPQLIFGNISGKIFPDGIFSKIDGFFDFFNNTVNGQSGTVAVLVQWVLPIICGLIFALICSYIIRFILKVLMKIFKK